MLAATPGARCSSLWARFVCRNVKRWQDAAMALRRTSADMLEAVKGFRRLKPTSNSPHCGWPWQLTKPTKGMSCCVIAVLKNSEGLSGLTSHACLFFPWIIYLIGTEAGRPRRTRLRNGTVIGLAKHRVDYGAGCLMGKDQKNTRSVSRIKNGSSEGHLDTAAAAQNWVPTRSIKMFWVKEFPAAEELRW
jgi:hypothetical protein